MVNKQFNFKLKEFINNSFENLDNWQEFIDEIFKYDEGSYSLYELHIYYSGVYNVLSEYESILHNELAEIKDKFKQKKPLECKDHAFNYFISTSLHQNSQSFNDLGKLDYVYINFTIEEVPNEY